ncbi:MAG TPA: F0F1 ATP synthase subunit B [Acidimicrobiia bacterium]|nr:F0F1 ATP synthase subunit B [Acidimicrobiia bacterium]
MLSLLTQAVFLLQNQDPFVETQSSSGGIELLLPHKDELIVGIITFAIVFFFVWKWAVPALNKTLEARQQAIRAELEAAEAAKVETESLLVDYRDQISGAKDEATGIVDEARAAGEQVKADIVARAETEADQIKTRAHDEIAGERERVTGALRREVADLSIGVAEKVVGTSLDSERQRELIERYIDELGGVH